MHNTRFSLPLIAISFLFVLSACTGTTSDTVRPVSATSVTPVAPIAPVSSSPQNPTTNTDTTRTQNTVKSITYSTDHGQERVTASFDITTTTDGTITAVNANMTNGNRESAQYISRFNSAAKRSIVGKKISSLSLSALGGASDTTDAFMQVVSAL